MPIWPRIAAGVYTSTDHRADERAVRLLSRTRRVRASRAAVIAAGLICVALLVSPPRIGFGMVGHSPYSWGLSPDGRLAFGTGKNGTQLWWLDRPASQIIEIKRSFAGLYVSPHSIFISGISRTSNARSLPRNQEIPGCRRQAPAQQRRDLRFDDLRSDLRARRAQRPDFDRKSRRWRAPDRARRPRSTSRTNDAAGSEGSMRSSEVPLTLESVKSAPAPGSFDRRPRCHRRPPCGSRPSPGCRGSRP